MAVIDNRLVRRSLSLRGQCASYDEAMSVGAGANFSWFAATHLHSFLSGRPKAGDGPSESVRRDGCFAFEILAKGAAGEECRVKVTGMGDPGYNATAVMLVESLLCLALDNDPIMERPSCGGVLTPSTAMGKALLRR